MELFKKINEVINFNQFSALCEALYNKCNDKEHFINYLDKRIAKNTNCFDLYCEFMSVVLTDEKCGVFGQGFDQILLLAAAAIRSKDVDKITDAAKVAYQTHAEAMSFQEKTVGYIAYTAARAAVTNNGFDINHNRYRYVGGDVVNEPYSVYSINSIASFYAYCVQINSPINYATQTELLSSKNPNPIYFKSSSVSYATQREVLFNTNSLYFKSISVSYAMQIEVLFNILNKK